MRLDGLVGHLSGLASRSVSVTPFVMLLTPHLVEQLTVMTELPQLAVQLVKSVPLGKGTVRVKEEGDIHCLCMAT